jgi:hypothetical protein
MSEPDITCNTAPSDGVTFYLGTHKAHWLSISPVPLFISHRTLNKRRTLPIANVDWCLDSGGFTELSMYGQWVTTPNEYIASIKRYMDESGRLIWASQQDMMCEDVMLKNTGLTVADHQRLTIDNFLTLRTLDAALPIIPVIQGQIADDYLRHIDDFYAAGIDLQKEPVVGIGSVCRRQATKEIVSIVKQVTDAGMNLHGFGVKTLGLRKIHHLMKSADSMAWSFAARRERIRFSECTHNAVICNNCMAYAVEWRKNLLNSLPIAHEKTALLSEV